MRPITRDYGIHGRSERVEGKGGSRESRKG